MTSSIFRWSAADAYLFDIDGTLLNSRDGVHYHAFNHAMGRYFGTSTKIDGVPVHGNTDPGIIRAVLEKEGFSGHEVESKLPLLFDHMCAEVERNRANLNPEVCPSVRELVSWLHNSGKLLGVASGNLERIAWAKLEACDLRKYFVFGSFSDQHEMRADIFQHGIQESRRRLGNDHAVVHIVGDTPADIQAAQAAGAPIIAVSTGIFSRDDLLAYRPDTCVSCCDDLLASM